MKLSVIVPCFNECEVIEETNKRLLATLSKTCVDFDIIYIDDGSKDMTLPILVTLQAKHPAHLKVLSFSRNFGHQAAVIAGLTHCQGDAAVIIDADLQDPPELIADMITKWQEGYQVVFAVREKREGETWFKLLTAKIFYRILKQLSDFEIPLDSGDFRLIDRKAIDALLSLPERQKFVRGLVAWVGFRQIGIPYSRQARFAGSTKYPISKMIKLAKEAVLSFSNRPLEIATYLGFASFAMAFAGIFYALVVRVFTNSWVAGWAMLFIGNLFFAGLQLMILGVIGEYIGLIYSEAKHRPSFIVAKSYGFKKSSAAKKSSKKSA